MFNGKENDSKIKGEGNSLNYTFRMHDPRVGRFLSLDPLAPQYPHNSPYCFSENRVIDGIELEGLGVGITISTKPLGEMELRIIGSEELKRLLPSKISVSLYELKIHDEVKNKDSTYLVTRDVLIIDSKAKPDKNGNFKVKNIAFEPKEGSSNKYEGLIIESFGSTELPAILLLQNGKNKLPAESVDSEFRKQKDVAFGITIHVGGPNKNI